VLHGVDLRVGQASVVALLGPNGAGKTTLLRTATGLLRPTKGRVLLDGKDVTGLGAHERARLGLCHLPEGRGIFPSLTVAENLVLLSPKGRERETRTRAIEAFPVLGQRLRQLAGSLSGGEQQMLALVRALAPGARIVLVDEASLGLAPVVVEQIFGVLAELARSGVALLIVEQYVAKALELASFAYLLNRGRVVFSGAAGELRREEVFERYLGATEPHGSA
jgi:branched-chain amino acid transport system ATP-binding protein